MKFVKVFVGIIILAIVGALVAGLLVDNFTSSDIEGKLKAIEPPASGTKTSSIVDSVSRTGKLSDPNGPLEFYGAILIESSVDYGSIVGYYKDKSTADLDIKVVSQKQAADTFGSDFPKELRFSHHDSSPDGFYIVYAFGEGNDPFPLLDFRAYI